MTFLTDNRGVVVKRSHNAIKTYQTTIQTILIAFIIFAIVLHNYLPPFKNNQNKHNRIVSFIGQPYSSSYGDTFDGNHKQGQHNVSEIELEEVNAILQGYYESVQKEQEQQQLIWDDDSGGEIIKHDDAAADLHAPNDVVRLDDDEITPDESIFFLETNNEWKHFLPRTLCSVESAARYNPERRIFLLFTTGSKISKTPTYLTSAGLSNIYIRQIDVTETVKNTLAFPLWDSGVVSASRFYYSHASDMLRFTFVYKFGGAYFDQDVISIRSLPTNLTTYNSTHKNFVVSAGNHEFIATAIFKMERYHNVMNTTLKFLRNRFDGHYWNKNGPVIITDAVSKYCQKKGSKGREDKFKHWTCSNFTILPPKVGCPINAGHYKLYYDFDKHVIVDDAIKNGFVFHYFNKMRTGTDKIKKDEIRMHPQHPLYQQMSKHCPLTERKLLRFMYGYQY